MLTRLLDSPLRLVVTLPGVSKHERAYSSLVEGAFRDGLIAGEFAARVRRSDLRLERIAAACDVVLSSSVQEGFGYFFVQSLQWGLPVLGRKLETIPDSGSLYEGYPARFYESLLCPVEPSEKSVLLGRYREKLKRIRPLLPAGASESLEQEISEVLAGESVDFSFLDTATQARLLAAVGEGGFRSAFRDLNRGLATDLNTLLTQQPPACAQGVEARFGLAAYAARVNI